MEIRLKKEITTVAITETELEIVKELSNDVTVRSAADNLGVNVRTMELRVANLKAKTGVKTLHGLLWVFYKNGLLK